YLLLYRRDSLCRQVVHPRTPGSEPAKSDLQASGANRLSHRERADLRAVLHRRSAGQADTAAHFFAEETTLRRRRSGWTVLLHTTSTYERSDRYRCLDRAGPVCAGTAAALQ